MIKQLLLKRYTIIDLISQTTAIYLVVKYNDYWYFLITIPFAFSSLLMESIERVNNGGKK